MEGVVGPTITPSTNIALSRKGAMNTTQKASIMSPLLEELKVKRNGGEGQQIKHQMKPRNTILVMNDIGRKYILA